jgi:hypothetical protein
MDGKAYLHEGCWAQNYPLHVHGFFGQMALNVVLTTKLSDWGGSALGFGATAVNRRIDKELDIARYGLVD